MNIFQRIFHQHQWGDLTKKLTQKCIKCNLVRMIKCNHPTNTLVSVSSEYSYEEGGTIFHNTMKCNICNTHYVITSGASSRTNILKRYGIDTYTNLPMFYSETTRYYVKPKKKTKTKETKTKESKTK